MSRQAEIRHSLDSEVITTTVDVADIIKKLGAKTSRDFAEDEFPQLDGFYETR